MGDKLTLQDLSSLANQTTAIAVINSNNQLIEDLADNILSRNGGAPNQMEAVLDMNGFKIINIAQGTDPGDIARIGDLVAGPEGPAGPSGASLYVGTGAPSGHNDGDSYIDLSTFNFYTKSGGSWTLQGNLVGPTGAGSGDMLRSNNLSDVVSASTARSNLGLAIGTNVQAYNAILTALSGVSPANGYIPYFSGTTTMAKTALTSIGIALLGAANAAGGRSTLGLGSSSTLNVGTSTGTVAAGDDTRFYNTSVLLEDATYSFALADRGKMIRHSSASAHAWTLQPMSTTAFTVGDSFLLRNAVSGGVVTITRGTGVTLYKAGSITSQDVQIAAGGMATVLMEDNNTWVISGTGLT